MEKVHTLDDYKKILAQLNNETERHSHSVAEISEAAADNLGMDSDLAYRIGLVHDIGKMYIPSRILKKNGGLSSIERDVVDLHSYYGYRILKEFGESFEVYMPVLLHHGFGKVHLQLVDEPVTEKVLKYTELVHCVDIFDAMSSKRAYHTPISFTTIERILKEDFLCSKRLLDFISDYDSAKR